MSLLAFGASTSSTSINQQFAEFTASAMADSYNIISLRDFECPIYSSDEEAANGIPDSAQHLHGLISEADVLVISFAEHNGSYPAAYKNLFDWMSRFQQKVFADKRVILLATSPGPGGAKNVLKQAETSMPFFGATVLGSFSLPNFHQSFSPESLALIDKDQAQRFEEFKVEMMSKL